jgi:ketosteroid isomerase-like protein
MTAIFDTLFHTTMKRTQTILLIALCFVTASAFSQKKKQDNPTTDSAAVANTVRDFIAAFTTLNWDTFTTFFADDVTAFFPPSANYPERTDSKEELENIFRLAFDNFRKGKSGPPYLTIVPLDQTIQLYGDIAIVTFMLNDPTVFGRRTLVFRKAGDRWLMIHMHGSGVPKG